MMEILPQKIFLPVLEKSKGEIIMKIEGSTNTFKGGFHFKNVDTITRKTLPGIISKNKRQLYFNLKEPGDIFLVTHDSDNHKVVDFIKSNNLNFDFYPKISTADNIRRPETLLEKINQQKDSIIRKIDFIKSPVKSSMSLTRAINTVSRTLRLNIDNPVVTKNDKVMTTIRDNSKERNINIILTKDNAYYVEVSPDSPNIDKTFAIFNSRGKFPKICENIDDRLNFMKKFKSLKDENANTLYKYKLQ